MISLSANNIYEKPKQRTFVPQQVSFTITPPNTNISIQRTFAMLESIQEQDLFKWREELFQTISLTSWDEQTAIRASVVPEYINLIQHKTSLSEIWDAIFKHKYPRSEYIKYLNQLSNTQQNSFLTIKEYHEEIERLSLRLGICLDWTEEMRQMKVQESFVNGLSKRTQLEMARLNIRECSEICAIINSTEETMLEQMKVRKSKPPFTNKEHHRSEKMRPNKKIVKKGV
ncbi:hypothetical protein EQH57_0250 [Dictyocoela roeselum]|nr:hypothetical protein EQH57_0250 [Dictyocoela roeselum]